MRGDGLGIIGLELQGFLLGYEIQVRKHCLNIIIVIIIIIIITLSLVDCNPSK
jgi:hypothetical protein